MIQRPGLTASQVRSIARGRSLMRSWLPQCQLSAAVGASVYTLASQWGLETDYDLVRLVFMNNFNGAFTIPLLRVAPSSALGDGHSPVNAAGANDFTIFQQVFWNNAGADVAPQDQTVWGSGVGTFTIPANTGSVLQPPRYYSDWVRMPSLARTDGGTTALLMCRTLTDASGTFRASTQGTQGWAPFAQGRVLTAYHKAAVDAVTVPSLLSAPTLLNFLSPYGVQYIGRAPGFTVLTVGDSLSRGFGSTTQSHGWGYLASMALSTPARPISFWNQGWQGQVSPDYWANGYTAFRACKPDVVTISVWTPNEGVSQANADLERSRAIDFADYVARNGAVPVLMGPCPWTGIITGPAELARLDARNRMLQMGANGMAVLDWESVLGTGANPNRIQPALLGVDGNHPNDAGNAAMATVFTPVLANILRA